jgi:hypothetical protein
MKKSARSKEKEVKRPTQFESGVFLDRCLKMMSGFLSFYSSFIISSLILSITALLFLLRPVLPTLCFEHSQSRLPW